MTAAWRLFIALELPPAVLKVIEQLQTELRQIIPPRVARWVRPEAIHLTLKFLGDVATGGIDELKAAIRQSTQSHQALELGIEGIGCFPDSNRPKVIWLGVTGDTKSLQLLQSNVERHVAPLGFPADKRGFNAHLTLARTTPAATRDDLARIGQISRERQTGLLVTWQADSVSLMRSQLRPEGAYYTQVDNVLLRKQTP